MCFRRRRLNVQRTDSNTTGTERDQEMKKKNKPVCLLFTREAEIGSQPVLTQSSGRTLRTAKCSDWKPQWGLEAVTSSRI